MNEDHKVVIQLLQGIGLTNLADIDLPTGDIGHALKLLEYCETFGNLSLMKSRN